MPSSFHTRRRQNGIALMLVLWIVALLTIIAIGMTTAQRTESTLAANQLNSVRFRAQADAAINYTALNLMAQPPLEDAEDTYLWIPDGVPQTWTFAGATLEIRIFDEASLINLNSADRGLLAALLSAIGVGEEDLDPLVDAILDWRDGDDLHLLNGAEDPDYEAAGRPYGAKDGPFDSVEELRQVLGFEPELYRALAPVLSVSPGKNRIVENLAPPLVLAALQGITLEEMEEQLLYEADADTVENEQTALDRGGPLYRIQVRRKTGDGAANAMEALVKIQSTATPPVSVIWRRFAPALEPTAGLADDGAAAN